MESSNEIYFIDPEFGTGPFTVPNVSLGTRPVYPSVYWLANPGKPKIYIQNWDGEESYHRLIARLNGLVWDDTTVSTFMIRVILENPDIFSETLDEDWKAERLIGKAGDVINPTSILDVITITPSPEEVGDKNKSTPAIRLSLFYALIMVYRKSIARKTNEYYGGQMAMKLNSFFQTGIFTANSKEILCVSGFIGEDQMSKGYKLVICALDMFFFKHPTKKHSSLRMATLPSRFKGCVAITALDQVARECRLSPRDLLMHVVTLPVAKEVAKISKSDEGMEDPHGYFPYQLEMGLTPKSAYSLSANPTLCLWLHTIGTTLGFARSINAKMPDALDRVGTMETAAVVGLSLIGKNEPQDKAGSIRAAMKRVAQMMEEESEEATGEKRSAEERFPPPDLVDQRVNDIITGLIVHKGLTPEQQRLLAQKAANCRVTGTDTVGNYFVETFGRR